MFRKLCIEVEKYISNIFSKEKKNCIEFIEYIYKMF